jgi:hypothetical protein
MERAQTGGEAPLHAPQSGEAGTGARARAVAVESDYAYGEAGAVLINQWRPVIMGQKGRAA